ncbi:MAG: hypothetical protein V7K89_03275 [Nostoc sp.]|uniref:hypothetical protein n=1 Tax=Nostoc sp. TaxID=1180 RepID=UPI002FF64355
MYALYGTGIFLEPKEFFDNSYPYQIGGGNLLYITINLEEIRRFYTEQPMTLEHQTQWVRSPLSR